jgi:hypothetical protein
MRSFYIRSINFCTRESHHYAVSSKALHASGFPRQPCDAAPGQTLGRAQHFISFNSGALDKHAVEQNPSKEHLQRQIYWFVSPNVRLALVSLRFSGTLIPLNAY